MISLETILFPNTDIFKDSFYPLLLFCAPIHYLQPVEPDPHHRELNEPDTFMERGLCQGHTPFPLGDNRDRFLRLVSDIENRKDEYAAQLSSLTMAAMTAPASQRNEEARYQIVSSLLKNHSVSASESDNNEMDRWQYRLILAIAEMLDREEEELQQHLQLLDNRELDMFRTLQGEDGSDEDDPFAELERIKANMKKPKPHETIKRFNAWRHLMSSVDLQKNTLWLASSQDSADQIFNEFEKQSDKIAIPVLKIPLPAKISVSTNYLIDQIKDFHDASGDIHLEIVKDLNKLVRVKNYESGAPENLLPNGTDWLEKWEFILDDHFPAHSHGRSDLTLYLLPEKPVGAMIGFKSPVENSDPPLHGLLGIRRN